jgi:[ribosomal protein S18]-alanine N-acetyltransferase
MTPVPKVRYRILRSGDGDALSDLFAQIDSTYFRPHPLTPDQAVRISSLAGQDVYAILEDGAESGGSFVAYGMLRGWDEGFEVPSLGVAVRSGHERRGLGRAMMVHLHAEATQRGAEQVRLRVHPDNLAAQRLYRSLGYKERGMERDELLMILDLPSRDSE